ncbi:MAG TPA: SLC13 family permease [Gammaproteobacteria bacterium]|nr:SLC13 family permease [Gammaproteobacteria bacterium]
MGVDAWLTIAVVGLALTSLIGTRIAPDLILVGALTVLILAGVVSPADALSGLGNPGLATVAVLYVVVAGLVDTGAVHAIGARLLGRPKSVSSALLRLMLPVTAVSAFLNNTPVVAMLVPVVEDWAKRSRLSVSKLMIPLSYAAILGGTCTLIGTSTNIIVNGLVQQRTDLGPIGFFAIGGLGLPTAIVGILYVLLAHRRLLPERKPPLRETAAGREYTIEMLVDETSPLIGKSVEQAGLRNLPGAFLAEIERADMVLPAVAPTEVLRAGDRLLFVGVVDTVVDLLRVRGLVPAPEQLFKLAAPRPERRLVEVVVSGSCPLVRQTIREGRFRSRYDAVVIAAARNGRRLPGKLGDIELQAGDTLLLETRPTFPTQHRNSRDFLLVSEVQGPALPRHERAWLATTILALMVGLTASGALSMFESALIAAGLMIATRCTSVSAARASIDWSVLIVIGAALGIGRALEASGAAEVFASTWIGWFGRNPWLALLGMYAITSAFTEFITNNAAAVIIFPIAQATAQTLNVSLWPFVFVIMMAASASFATPIGYQTNLMVYGPGGYRFTDYVRFGLPLNILLGAVAVALAPLIWPF